jgi:hypothetical protein
VSQGECLLVNIQGTGYQLCDPEVASKALMSDVGGAHQLNFCIANLSTEAIETFFETHKCIIYCIMLGLKQDDPKYHVSFEIYLSIVYSFEEKVVFLTMHIHVLF